MCRIAAAVTLAFLVACAAGNETGLDAAGGADAGDGPDSGPRADAFPLPPDTAVYAHSSTELFTIDPDTFNRTSVGLFTFSGESEFITDIAVDKDGNMVGISLNTVYAIDPDTAATTLLSQFPESEGGLTSLSFVPVDIDDPSSAARLVAADFDGVVWEINKDTGQRTMLGNYNATGSMIGSSGDIVSITGFGTLATVNIEGDDTDHLARIDPDTWQAIVLGDTGRDRIFGIGFWGGEVYGFTDNMEFVTIDASNGQVTSSQNTGIRWWGAGVTTIAPTVD
jgi:hypothetical protein